MSELDWLQEVYKDYCSKHGLDHVSTCEQSGLTPEQWEWIENFNQRWDYGQSQSDNQFKSWLDTCPFEYDIIYDGSNAIEDKIVWTGQVDLAVYTRKKHEVDQL